MAKVDKLIKQSQEHLSSDESVVAAVMGVYETEIMGSSTVKNGIFIATESRLVFYSKKLFGFNLESFPYKNLSSIELSKGAMGHIITFVSSGNKVSMKWINDHASREKDVKGFVEYIKNSMETKPPLQAESNVETTIPEKIKQLSELHKQSILTDDEFNNKKQELLAQM